MLHSCHVMSLHTISKDEHSGRWMRLCSPVVAVAAFCGCDVAMTEEEKKEGEESVDGSWKMGGVGETRKKQSLVATVVRTEKALV